MFFDNFCVGHFEFKMADILTQNLKPLLLGPLPCNIKSKSNQHMSLDNKFEKKNVEFVPIEYLCRFNSENQT